MQAHHSFSFIYLPVSFKRIPNLYCKYLPTFKYFFRKGDNLEVLSCTDIKCAWKQDHSKALEEYDAAPLKQHSCFAEPVKIKQIINPSSIKDCYEHEEHEDNAEEEAENETGEIETRQPIQSSDSREIVAIKKKKKTCSRN